MRRSDGGVTVCGAVNAHARLGAAELNPLDLAAAPARLRQGGSMSSYLGTLRKRVGLSVEELAVKAGVPDFIIAKDERCGQCPDLDSREKISAAIGFSESVIWPDAK